MSNQILRKEIDEIIKRMKCDNERLKILAYLVWKKECGELMEDVPVSSHGYRKVLRALGYVI